MDRSTEAPGRFAARYATHTNWARLLPPLSRLTGDSDKDWERVLKLLQRVPALAEIPQLCDKPLVQLRHAGARFTNDSRKLRQLTSARTISRCIVRHAVAFESSRTTCDEIIDEMDFRSSSTSKQAIHDRLQRHRVTRRRFLLRSAGFEARLASFVGIAKGDVPQQHWFRMGRALTKVDGGRALISWTGTMFEYLMPLLVMRNYPNTLLSETYRTIVERQIEYGEERGVPWGISEAAYNVRDLHLNYQYGPFGVPVSV